MWLFKMFRFMARMTINYVIPFLMYLSFWVLNAYNCAIIPGVQDEAILRFWAAVFFPFGIVWGMFDAIMMVIAYVG